MTINKPNDFSRKLPLYDEAAEDDDSSSGGQAGEIEFRYKDAFTGPTRDDLLAPAEIKRLQIVHKDVHKARVEKQKALIEERAAIQEGKYVSSMEKKLGQGGGPGGASKFKKHPISDLAQFSGIDKQVSGVPTLNEANTNDEMRNELENRLENRLQNQPKFNPRPSPLGGG